MLSAPAKTSAASSGPAWVNSRRLPPAKKVFLALAMTTPVTSSCSAYSRSTAAAMPSR